VHHEEKENEFMHKIQEKPFDIPHTQAEDEDFDEN